MKLVKEPVKEVVEKKCEVCGLRLTQHPRCGYCYILVGPKHWEKNLAGLVKGKPICASCREVVRRCPQSLRPVDD